MDKHGQTSPDALEVANTKFETGIARSAKTQRHRVLKLHTARAANRVHLEQDDTGRLSLFFRGLRYGVDDCLPSSIFGGRSISPGVTAGEFVCRQMLRDYGYHEADWPAVARQFLIAHRNCRPDRSRS